MKISKINQKAKFSHTTSIGVNELFYLNINSSMETDVSLMFLSYQKAKSSPTASIGVNQLFHLNVNSSLEVHWIF